MKEQLQSRFRNPWVAALAIGIFLLGSIKLVTSVQSRATVRLRPTGASTPVGLGYQGLIGDLTVPRDIQYVVTTTVDLVAGDRIEAELIERRNSRQVVAQFPTLKSPAAQKDPKAPLLEGYYDQLATAVGKYALTDLRAGMPLGTQTVSSESPLSNPIDRQRPDRFTIPMAKEPTLISLLRPGDRVDLFLVVPGQISRRSVLNVRVVAVNNYLVSGSGLLDSQAEQARFGVQYEASQRKRQRILARNRTAGAQPPPPAVEPDKAKADEKAKTEPGKTEPDKAAPAAPVGEPGKLAPPKEAPKQLEGAKIGAGQNFDEQTGKVAKGGTVMEFDGRAVTVQVSPAESLLLALAMRSPNVTIELALRPRS